MTIKTMIKELFILIISMILPGAGHLILKDYKKGIIILLIQVVGFFVFPILSYYYFYIPCMIVSVVDLYLKLQKENGTVKTTRSLVFAIIVLLILIPALVMVMIKTFRVGGRFVADNYISDGRTNEEMKEISIALDVYYNKYHKYPADYKKFIRTKPIWSGWESDSWDENYRYIQKDSADYLLQSSGKDKRFDTNDDLRIANN